jgi:hypothetical protein
MHASFPSLLAQAAPAFPGILPHDIIPVIAVTLGIGGGVLIALTAIIMGNWRRVRDRKIVASLIQDMLDRNMSAVEIQQVMSTWQSMSDSDSDIPVARFGSPMPGRPPKPAKMM